MQGLPTRSWDRSFPRCPAWSRRARIYCSPQPRALTWSRGWSGCRYLAASGWLPAPRDAVTWQLPDGCLHLKENHSAVEKRAETPNRNFVTATKPTETQMHQRLHEHDRAIFSPFIQGTPGRFPRDNGAIFRKIDSSRAPKPSPLWQRARFQGKT